MKYNSKVKATLFSLLAILSVALLAVQLMTAPALAQGRPGDAGGGGGGGGGGGDGGGGSSGTRFAEIRGVVTDLDTGQPAGGVEVSVNGSVVRTDTLGRYSITGLQSGTYTVQLNLQQGTSAQNPQVVQLPDQGLAIVDMQFFSSTQPVATATPAPLPEPTATPALAVQAAPAAPAAESPPELPSAGGILPDNSFLPFSNLAVASANAKTILPLSEAMNVVAPVTGRALLPVPHCDTIRIVANDALLMSRLDDNNVLNPDKIIEATNMLRVESKNYSNVTSLGALSPGRQLCVPGGM